MLTAAFTASASIDHTLSITGVAIVKLDLASGAALALDAGGIHPGAAPLGAIVASGGGSLTVDHLTVNLDASAMTAPARLNASGRRQSGFWAAAGPTRSQPRPDRVIP
ncbi:MAG: hypothetical protein WDO24_03710 [Pseudomonadota bacterium]